MACSGGARQTSALPPQIIIQPNQKNNNHNAVAQIKKFILLGDKNVGKTLLKNRIGARTFHDHLQMSTNNTSMYSQHRVQTDKNSKHT